MRTTVEAVRKIVPLQPIVAVALVAVAVYGCIEDYLTEAEEEVLVQVTKVNDDEAPVHILGPGEDFPDGRLPEGSSRSVTYSTGSEFPVSVSFRAGRNGQVLATVDCQVHENAQVLDVDPPTYGGAVVWSPGGLACGGGLTGS